MQWKHLLFRNFILVAGARSVGILWSFNLFQISPAAFFSFPADLSRLGIVKKVSWPANTHEQEGIMPSST